MKIVGLFLLLLGGAGMGQSRSLLLRKRLEELKTLQQMILLLKGEISYGNMSLPEAFQMIQKKLPNPFQTFLLELSRKLELGQGEEFSQIFEMAVQEHLQSCQFSKEDLEGLYQAGKQLGFLDRKNQLHQLELYEKNLERTLEAYQKELPEKRKICEILGILSGLFFAVLLF